MAKRNGGITIEFTNLDQVLKDLQAVGLNAADVLGEAVMAGAEVVKDEAKAKEPGADIQAELHEKKRNKATAHVGPHKKKWYYIFKETGAKPHPITPKKRRALSWADGVFAEVDLHPGQPADPFLRPALDENVERIQKGAGKVIKNAIE